MPFQIPPRPTGSDPSAIFMQWVWETLVFMLRPTQTPGSATCRTTKGFYNLPILTRKEEGSSSAQIKKFTIASLHGDYVTAADGTLIAKEVHLRTSLLTEVIDGVTLNYGYTDDNNRIADDGSHSEKEVMFPRYVTSGPTAEIIAAKIDGGTGVTMAPDWMEIKPARVWARRYIQT